MFKRPLPFVVALMCLNYATSAFAQNPATPSGGFDPSKVDQKELARLKAYDKPLQDDVVGNVILGGGPIAGAAKGGAASGAKALATGVAVRGTKNAAAAEYKGYKGAKKIEMSKEPDKPEGLGGGSSGGAVR